MRARSLKARKRKIRPVEELGARNVAAPRIAQTLPTTQKKK